MTNSGRRKNTDRIFIFHANIFDTSLSFARLGFSFLSGFVDILPFFPSSSPFFFFGFVRTPRFALLHGSHRVRPPFKFISPFTIPSLFLFRPLLDPCHLFDGVDYTVPRDRGLEPGGFHCEPAGNSSTWLTTRDDDSTFPFLLSLSQIKIEITGNDH